jgi:hypothetical protein
MTASVREQRLRSTIGQKHCSWWTFPEKSATISKRPHSGKGNQSITPGPSGEGSWVILRTV